MAATAQDPSAPLRSGDKQKDEDRDDDAAEYSPFYGIEKGAVLQEARIFNDSHVDARRCQQVITKLLYLLCQGETFTKKEATDVFFSVTKLFQAKDANLRRMVYLVIKEVCPGSDEVIIITSSLMKDMNSKTDLYRSNAIRVLCSIADSQVLGNIERYFKQAVVDKSAPVASAVLVSAMHLLKDNLEIVKRWTSEIQEVVQSKHGMVQFHAVALLHALRARDRLAVSKLVSSLVRGSVRSPMAQCLLVRYVAQVIAESGASAGGEPRPFYDFLEGCLRHKSEMVIFEAARAICGMPDVSSRELTPAVTTLQLFLSSSKPVLRFAAVRTLNRVAMAHPLAVTNCNIDLEGLITDGNRPIATLAITTLLKTGSEGSVDRLLKQIGAFMADIADEFKIVVVEAIRALCLKFPQKYRSLMNFLSSVLREDGGFEYKKAIVDSILILIREIPDAKEPGLGHLCEFIEDCEFTYLSTQILHLLGAEGPGTRDPAKYIRYIYNRVILENATVRAAAVSSLARFGQAVEGLRPRVLVLLRRALHDNDDEVRDRATLHLAQLQGEAGSASGGEPAWDVPARNLEQALLAYLDGDQATPFQLASVPKAPPKEQKKDAQTAAPSAAPAARSDYAAELAAVPALAPLGAPFKSSPPERLTEEETEYSVAVVKHVFAGHLLLQFDCTNTVAEQVLEDVSVALDLDQSEELVQAAVVPLPRMAYNEVGRTYVLLERPEGGLTFDTLVPTLHFRVKEIDPATGEAEEDGYDDQYQLEAFDLGAADYIQAVPAPNFRASWEALGEASELSDDYGLGQRESLQEAVEAVAHLLGMAPCEGSDAVPPNARSHTLLLSGSLMGDVQVLVRLSLGIDAGRNVAMKLAVRASSPELSEMIHQIVQAG